MHRQSPVDSWPLDRLNLPFFCFWTWFRIDFKNDPNQLLVVGQLTAKKLMKYEIHFLAKINHFFQYYSLNLNFTQTLYTLSYPYITSHIQIWFKYCNVNPSSTQLFSNLFSLLSNFFSTNFLTISQLNSLNHFILSHSRLKD